MSALLLLLSPSSSHFAAMEQWDCRCFVLVALVIGRLIGLLSLSSSFYLNTSRTGL